MKRSLSKLTQVIFIAAILLQIVMPFVYPIVGHDGPVHLNWLEQFPGLFREGNLYPRWMPESFWGFGSPAFYFYPPLTYWIASLLSFFIATPAELYQLLGLVATVCSGFTCYYYLKSISENRHTSVMGALIYAMGPYRVLDLYLRNAIGEHLAFVFLPLLFLSVEKALQSVSARDKTAAILISATSWAGILLTNIPASVIACYSVVIYATIRVNRHNYLKLLFPFVGALLGGCIATIYLLPAYTFSSAIKLSHFWDRWSAEHISGFSIIDSTNGLYRYFYVGLVVTLAIGIWLLRPFYRHLKERKDNISRIFFWLLLVAVFLQIPYISYPVWRYFPLFSFLQFTWRWNMIIVLASGVFVATHHPQKENANSKLFSSLNLLVTIAIAVGYFITMGGLHPKTVNAPGYIDAPEYLPAITSDTIEVSKKLLKEHSNDPLVAADDPGAISISSTSNASITFSKRETRNPAQVIFRRSYFPAWKLWNLKTGEITLTPDSIGRSTALLNKEAGDYSLRIEESGDERTAKIISLAGVSLLICLAAATVFLRNSKVS